MIATSRTCMQNYDVVFSFLSLCVCILVGRWSAQIDRSSMERDMISMHHSCDLVVELK